MGVVHKLKQEIIDFIVQSKTKDSNLSCRVIAELVWRDFRVDVSKSSVNEIIKNAKLSSKVGRRSSSGKSFTLPDFRKKQFYENMKKTGLFGESGILEKKSESLADVSKTGGENEITKEITKGEVSEKIFDETDVFNVREGNPQSQREEKVEKIGSPQSGFLGKDISSEEPVCRREIDFSNQVSPDLIKKTIIKSEQELPPETVVEKFVLENDFLEEVERLRLVYHKKESQQIIGLGTMLLFAAKWGVCGPYFWRNIFSDRYGLSLEEAVDTRMQEMVRSFFSVKEKELQEGHVLGEEGYPFSLPRSERAEIPEKLTPEELASYQMEKEQKFVEISGYGIHLQNGKIIFLDAFFESCFSAMNQISLRGIPVDKATIFLSQNIITNNSAIFLKTLPYFKQGIDLFYDFLAFSSGQKGFEIREIFAFNSSGERVIEFLHIPQMKRDICVGCWRGHPLFKELVQNASVLRRKPIFRPVEDRVYSFAERMFKMGSQGHILRIIILWRGTEENPCGFLLTNSDQSTNLVVHGFMDQHPLEEKNAFFVSKALFSESEQSVVCSEWLKDGDRIDFVVSDFLGMLHKYVVRHFLPQKYAFLDLKKASELFYSAGGVLTISKHAVIISLKQPASLQLTADFEILAAEVNRSQIKDPQDRQIRIEIGF